MSKKINNKTVPLSSIDKKNIATMDLIEAMIREDADLYDKILNNPYFEYFFNQIANKAIHYDFLQKEAGLIPEDYPWSYQPDEVKR